MFFCNQNRIYPLLMCIYVTVLPSSKYPWLRKWRGFLLLASYSHTDVCIYFSSSIGVRNICILSDWTYDFHFRSKGRYPIDLYSTSFFFLLSYSFHTNFINASYFVYCKCIAFLQPSRLIVWQSLRWNKKLW